MRVFVNFRPEITDFAVAGRFKSLLLASKAFDDVAMSPENPAPLDDYGSRAAAAISECDAFIALVGPGWADRRDAQGRLIDNPRDPVRAEITAALDRIMPMVPVLLDGATLPDASEITPALQGLALRDSVAVTLASLDRDFPRLLAAIAPGFADTAADDGPDTRSAGQKPSRSRPAGGLPAAAPLEVSGPTGFRARFLRQRSASAGSDDEILSSNSSQRADGDRPSAQEETRVARPAESMPPQVRRPTPRPEPAGPTAVVALQDRLAGSGADEGLQRVERPGSSSDAAGASAQPQAEPETRGFGERAPEEPTRVQSKSGWLSSVRAKSGRRREARRREPASPLDRPLDQPLEEQGEPLQAPEPGSKTRPTAMLCGVVGLALFAAWIVFRVMSNQLAALLDVFLDAI